jgi:Na+-driven multidrug efflux pump
VIQLVFLGIAYAAEVVVLALHGAERPLPWGQIAWMGIAAGALVGALAAAGRR